MEILELLEAKNKAERVIDSCHTLEQLEGAERYVEFFYDRFESLLDKSELDSAIINKRKFLSLPFGDN